MLTSLLCKDNKLKPKTKNYLLIILCLYAKKCVILPS